MSNNVEQKMIMLKTADNEIFEVELWIMKDFISDADLSAGFIPLTNVMSLQFSRIVEYLRRLSGNSKKFEKFKDSLKALKPAELMELLVATNYLDVKDLIDFASKTITYLIQNKSVEFVRKLFSIKNDYSPEEEAEYRQNHYWAFEGVDSD